jgi:hypothetical protein
MDLRICTLIFLLQLAQFCNLWSIYCYYKHRIEVFSTNQVLLQYEQNFYKIESTIRAISEGLS